MLPNGWADYLFARSTGHIGSFVTLITRGCFRAIRTGAEQLTTGLLDAVRIDVASEQARDELAAAFAAGRPSTKPRAATRAAATSTPAATGTAQRDLLAITGICQAGSLARYARHVDGAPAKAALRAWDRRQQAGRAWAAAGWTSPGPAAARTRRWWRLPPGSSTTARRPGHRDRSPSVATTIPPVRNDQDRQSRRPPLLACPVVQRLLLRFG
jgi:hypothetical protein